MKYLRKFNESLSNSYLIELLSLYKKPLTDYEDMLVDLLDETNVSVVRLLKDNTDKVSPTFWMLSSGKYNDNGKFVDNNRDYKYNILQFSNIKDAVLSDSIEFSDMFFVERDLGDIEIENLVNKFIARIKLDASVKTCYIKNTLTTNQGISILVIYK